MKKIKIIFPFLGYNSFNQLDISIYKGYKKIFNGRTYNNEIELCLEKNNVYIIKSRLINTCFYVNDRDIYYFSLYRNNNPITFILRDRYYNYPIERGELLLWQNQ